jgi:hypothetical protein
MQVNVFLPCWRDRNAEQKKNAGPMSFIGPVLFAGGTLRCERRGVAVHGEWSQTSAFHA